MGRVQIGNISKDSVYWALNTISIMNLIFLASSLVLVTRTSGLTKLIIDTDMVT